MALPLPPGLTPAEVAFLCEMELVTVIPRQKLDSLHLLGGPVPVLQPPLRNNVPLWLALLLKKQRRANIVPPPWLNVESLSAILDHETERAPEDFSPPPKLPPIGDESSIISPPFLPTSTADGQPNALPYHWMELGEILLEAASDDFEDVDQVRRLLRDLREARLAKLRSGIDALDSGGGKPMNGIGGMEVAEGRSFICGVIDSLRKIGAAKEMAKREREDEDRTGYQGTADDEDEDMDMLR
ncbi:DNA replication complex GINS protein-like protein psf2 [Microthyrium microscopicum]|uniref:DNA replication complex GINS protein PSF2 n=1 Tax=Microthyrium microscopicum TaxID=703497 RepID=A0A6A6UNZ2_9PEZI|nr:DNA replication complex GINS protein-like protein psf2 [Microthyrium microscopicum]